MLPFPGKLRRKGNVKWETQRNPLLLRLARSKKGNGTRGNRRNMLPFPGEFRRKGNVNWETQRNPLPLRLARS